MENGELYLRGNETRYLCILPIIFEILFSSKTIKPKYLYITKDFDYIHRGEGFYEIVPKGYSKATGMQCLCDYFKVGIEDCYAFGDSNNDLPMLSYVPHSIAMGESSEELKKQVEYVTTGVLEDGILNAMKYYGLC